MSRTTYVLSTGTALPGPAIDNRSLCERTVRSRSGLTHLSAPAQGISESISQQVSRRIR